MKMGPDDDICITGLVLGLGLEAPPHPSKTQERPQTKKQPCVNFEPSLTLTLSADHEPSGSEGIIKREEVFRELHRRVSDPYSAISSFSNSISVKRERDQYDELGAERVSSRKNNFDEDEDCSNTRKKLRLTKDQSAVLEESFKQHSTLNPKQKQVLARQLNLRPRQVEVWFQNRRARTKLKQTEVDCEFLKKCCETLTDENRRLQKELQELKALKVSHPLYMQLPTAKLTMCPSCERFGGDHGPSKSPFSMASQPHFFGPYTKPSAAC